MNHHSIWLVVQERTIRTICNCSSYLILFQTKEGMTHLFGRRLKSSQFDAIFITIFLQYATSKMVFDRIHYTNLCVSMINEAGQKDSQVYTHNENLYPTFLEMLKCNFALFSICQASTWPTAVCGESVP